VYARLEGILPGIRFGERWFVPRLAFEGGRRRAAWRAIAAL